MRSSSFPLPNILKTFFTAGGGPFDFPEGSIYKSSKIYIILCMRLPVTIVGLDVHVEFIGRILFVACDTGLLIQFWYQIMSFLSPPPVPPKVLPYVVLNQQIQSNKRADVWNFQSWCSVYRPYKWEQADSCENSQMLLIFRGRVWRSHLLPDPCLDNLRLLWGYYGSVLECYLYSKNLKRPIEWLLLHGCWQL